MGADRAITDAGHTNIAESERIISAISGGALLAYGIARLSRAPLLGAALTVAGGALAYRGLSGHCPVYQALDIDRSAQPRHTTEQLMGGSGLEVRRSITVNRPAQDLYRFWRDFSNLPLFMGHIESVRPLSDTLSHWVVRAPLGTTVEWDADIINDHENEMIAWHSGEQSDVSHAGLVRFRETDRGTVVETRISYRAPLRGIGVALAKLLGDDPASEIEADLRRFKQLMEAGEIPTTAGQPRGGR